MNNPELYARMNVFQRKDAKDIMEKLEDKLNWKSNDGGKLIDIGSGPGDILNDFIIPMLPINFEKIVASDISTKMLHYAKDHFGNKESRIDYQKLDIGIDNLTIRETFDHLSSFFCLNFVKNERQAIKNMYDLVKPGGDAVIAFIGNFHLYYLMDILAANPAWAPHMLEVSSYASPYRHSKHPAADFKQRLEEAGFKDVYCEAMKKKIIFEEQQFFEYLPISERFKEGTPYTIRTEFPSAVFDLMKEFNMVTKSEEGTMINLYHTCIVAHAKK